MKRIDILFYLYGMDGGGAERHVLYLLQRLDRARFSPRLFLKTADGPYLKDIPKDVPVERLYRSFAEERRAYTYLKDVRLIGVFARYLNRRPPDLVYCRMYSSATVAGLAIRCSGKNIPMIASEGIYPSVGIVPDLGRFPSLRLPIVKKVQRDISSLIVCPAAAMAEDGVSFYGCPREKIRIIPNGVDLDLLARRKSEAPSHPWAQEEKPLIVAMGRLCHQKGFDVLLDAFSLVARDVPGARLLVLGKGEDRAALSDKAKAMSIADRVDFPGWLQNPHAVVARATAFVLSSRYEGFPNALLEAMALGVPVVSTDCPSGPREILEGGAGFLVPVEDSAAMARALGDLLADTDLRTEVTRRGRERIADRYSLEGMVSAYESLVEEVVSGVAPAGFRAERKIPEMSSSSSV